MKLSCWLFDVTDRNGGTWQEFAEAETVQKAAGKIKRRWSRATGIGGYVRSAKLAKGKRN